MSTDNNNKVNTMELVAPYFISSVERTAELQKKCLDTAASQFREWIALNKKLAIFVPAPIASLFDVAERTFEKGVEAQKNLIDVAVEQSQTIVRLSNERQPDFSKVAEEMTAIVRKSVEQATATQKDFTDFAAEETRKASDIVIQQFGLAGTPVAAAADTFKKNIGSMVEMQKTMVDIATKPLKADAAKAK
jgi:MarR-like DNA-binding transcriptional regulator SgrR of sgrS sRNA